MDMDKRFFKRFLKRLRFVNLWLLLVIAVVSGVTCVFALRNNNLQALALRDEVYRADKEGGDVETALRDLRQFMHTHMNSSLSTGSNSIQQPIQLKYRYERLVKAEQDRMASANSQLYAEAQADCERRYPNGLYGSGRIPCVTEYVTARSPEKPKEIPDSLYKFDFVSPVWSPDLAGWSLVVASLSFGLFVLRFGMERWARKEIHDL